jgi:modulator of FtsH protease HflK
MSDFEDGFPKIIRNAMQGGGPPEVDPEAVGKGIVTLLIIGFVLIGGYTSYFQVGTDQEAVMLRFGRYHSTVGPGPHFKIPFGVDTVFNVPTKRQMKMELGFRTAKAAKRTSYRRDRSTAGESIMLTGDLNVADIEWVVQYQIQDPKAYLFHARNIDLVIRDLAEATMRQVVGDHGVNYLLTGGRDAVGQIVKQRLSEAVKHYDLGLRIDQLIIQDVNPPEPVKPSFNEVNQAQQERERSINEAMSEYNRVIPQAQGRSEQQVSQAEGYAAARVNRASGDVANFIAVQAAYAKSRTVTRSRLHLEMLQDVLPKVKRKWIIDGARGGGLLRHLDLGKGVIR